jgi:hypothetical protein
MRISTFVIFQKQLLKYLLKNYEMKIKNHLYYFLLKKEDFLLLGWKFLEDVLRLKFSWLFVRYNSSFKLTLLFKIFDVGFFLKVGLLIYVMVI